MNGCEKNNLFLLQEDYDLLADYIRHKKALLQAQLLSPAWLYQYLEEAVVLPLEEFPEQVVRLNTVVTLRDTVGRYIYSYTVVMPEEADHRKGKVSLLSPIGAALFGARLGEDVCWQKTNDRRLFTVRSVKQPKASHRARHR